MAAARAAAAAIRMICQPGIPPAVITWTGADGAAGTGPYGPSPGIGMTEADAAGTAAAQASTPPATTARAAVIRRSRVVVRGWVPRRDRYVNMMGSCSDLAGYPGRYRQVLPAGWGRGSGRVTPFRAAASPG